MHGYHRLLRLAGGLGLVFALLLIGTGTYKLLTYNPKKDESKFNYNEYGYKEKNL